MKIKHIGIGLAVLTALGGLSAVQARDSGQYVSREEYEKLKLDFERMKALVEQMEKRLAQQPPPAGEASMKELSQVKQELQQVKAEAKEAKKQAKAALPGERKFLITGYGFAGFTNGKHSDSSFNAGLNPIFLWRLRDDIFFEGEAELELEDGETNISLEFAQLSYFLNDYVTLGAGKFLNPTNYFMERLHPAWINKLPETTAD
ncbi:MAG TPA: hypothetical protein ENI90_09945 [Methylothermaceae bacterium]|nr:hypothetical protein [Methylothermaceae bacterium]